jgi:DNA-binding NarL/FixJ family response regulator
MRLTGDGARMTAGATVLALRARLGRPTMIRILLVDDHPAMRAGLTGVLAAEPGLVPVDAVASGDELAEALDRTQPDVVVLDYHLPGHDGLVLCRRLKRERPAPAVLVYSAYADAHLAIPAVLAGADGLLHKGATAPELYDAIRAVADGQAVIPSVPAALIEAAGARLEPEDMPILGMRLEGAATEDIAGALRCEPVDVAHRIDRMLGRLRVSVPAPAG